MSSPKYLIVDSDPAKGREMGKLLYDSGASSDHAGDLTKATELLSTTKYDCVLVDRDVPFDWTSSIREQTSESALSFMMFLTGPHGSIPPSAVFISGMDGYVQRHKDSTRLLTEHVRRAISSISKTRLSDKGSFFTEKEIRKVFSREEKFADSKIIVQTQRIPAPGPVEDIVRVTDRGNGQYSILLGDCTFPARLAEFSSMMIGSRIETHLAESAGPSIVLSHLNEDLFNAGQAVDFMTGVTCFIDLPNRLLEYSVAGHQPPLHRRWGASSWRILPGSGIPLGIRQGEQFQQHSRRLQSGDKILLLSDGIMKINGGSGGFMEEALKAIDMLPLDAAPSEVIESIGEHIESVTGGKTLADEITATLIQV